MEFNEVSTEIANVIIQAGSSEGKHLSLIMRDKERNSNLAIYLNVFYELRDQGFISIYSNVPEHPLYKLTPKGFGLKQSDGGYEGYLKQVEEQKQKKIEREERDEQIKVFQYEDLKRKVTQMNDEQLRFWHRQRWQFWLTLFLASAAFIMSILNFIRDMYIPKPH